MLIQSKTNELNILIYRVHTILYPKRTTGKLFNIESLNKTYSRIFKNIAPLQNGGEKIKPHKLSRGTL